MSAAFWKGSGGVTQTSPHSLCFLLVIFCITFATYSSSLLACFSGPLFSVFDELGAEGACDDAMSMLNTDGTGRFGGRIFASALFREEDFWKSDFCTEGFARATSLTRMKGF